MPRKRKYGITSDVRYKLKMFKLTGQQPPQEVAVEYVNSLHSAFNIGFGEYYKVRKKVVESDVWSMVPSALRGLYLAFVNEVQHKVLTRGIATIDEVINKWTRLGLDPELLWLIAEVMGIERPETSQPQPASKA